MQSSLYSGSHYFPKSYRINSYIARTSSPHSLARDRSRSPPPLLRSNVNIGNSKLSNNSQINQNPLNAEVIRKIVEDIGIYPNGFAQLLKNEDKNIKNFKLQITNQKEKVDEDISSFKIQINHTLEDLRLSIHAHLDRVYQAYLDKMAKFRGQMFQIHRLKEQLQMELGATSNFTQLQAKVKQDIQTATHHKKPAEKDSLSEQNLTSPGHNSIISPQVNGNFNTSLQQQTLNKISSMQVGNKQYQKYYVLNYIAELQKERVGPLVDLQRELVVLNSYQNGYYQSKQFLHLLAGFREVLSSETRKIYDKNYIYIRDIDSIVIKQKEQVGKVLDGLDLNPSTNYSKVIGQGAYIPITSTFRPLPTVSAPFFQGIISSTEQSISVNGCESINIAEQPINIQLPNNLRNQTALCGVFINNQIALGLKEGVIQILSCDGHNITTLKQHTANICTLSVIRTKSQNYLASGADVGCCRVIIWDPVNWQPRHIFTTHQAAVTAILDLQDDTHVLSTGYDSKLNIYSLQQGKQIYSVPQTQGPMTSALINNNGSRVVGCGLDKAIYVWQVVRDQRRRVENLVLQRKIQNNATISSMVPSQLVPQLIVIATKDSKIKLVNIEKGSSYKTINLSATESGSPYPLEICLVQRNQKQHYPLVLIWAYKEARIYKADTETTLVDVKNLGVLNAARAINQPGCMLEFGYGVNPKSWFVPDSSRGVFLYSVNHRMAQGGNCVSVYRLESVR